MNGMVHGTGPDALPAPVTAIEIGNTIPRVLVRQAQRFGAKPLIAFPRQRQSLSYDGLLAFSKAGAYRLQRVHGLAPGTIAAIYLQNSADYVKSWFSCLFAGVVDAPINREFRKSSLFFGLTTAAAEAVFTDGQGVEHLVDPEVRGYLGNLRVLVLAGDYDRATVDRLLSALPTPVPVVELDALTAPGPDEDLWATLKSNEPALIRFTSGTTGPAKGILQSHLHVLAKSAVHNEVLEYGPDDVLYTPFPLHHNLASINGLIGTLQAGGTMVSVAKFSASGFWREARECGATLAHLLQSIAPLVSAQPPSPDDRNHRVRYLWSGRPDPVFEERFNVRRVQLYALGEVGVVSYKRGGEEAGAGMGRPLPQMEVRIIDPLDRPVPSGTVGEITVRPRQPHRVMLAYHNNLPATMRAFRNLWFHTGDGGYFNETGELCFAGRMGDTIRRRGVNISSEQIDAEIRRYAAIEDCGVIAVPSETGEQEIHACLVWKADPGDGEKAFDLLSAFLAERLPKSYLPRFYESMQELPRTNTGKVRKAALRERPRYGPTWDREKSCWIQRSS
ncbi:AMP-binding protein [Verticiella sediminum]|uniref:AMP-binding protein n=1 Tax=Verticiella sediminum TaxID=1247510 RepID=A0A556A6F7_9BURK|nr:AMP-binding protein [Verticiella sediminum]TSH88457.1 AMP-binding protein [Verticiella sediminum]